MKWIDEKGRLFGKLNIIDALVLIILVLAVALVGVKLWSNHQSALEEELLEQERLEQERLEQAEEHWVVYTVKVTEVDPASYAVAQRYVDRENGCMDQMLTNTGLQDGYVVDVTATPHVTYVENADGTVRPVESSGADERLDLMFTCVGNVKDFLNNNLGGQEIRVNITNIVKTVHLEFRSGVVLSVEWLDDRSELAQYLDLDVLNDIREDYLAQLAEENAD